MAIVEKPEIPSFGIFEDVITPRLKIQPKTEVDAQQWFEELLVIELPNNYLLPSAYDSHVSRIMKKFKQDFNLVAPTQEELAHVLFNQGDTVKAWLLQAPLDLAGGAYNE